MNDCGIFLLNKESGMTSHTAVGKLRRLLGGQKAGHTGTLDPMATGVLPVLVGRGVKAAAYLTDSDKCYRATLTLGAVTDTEDSEGHILSTCDNIPDAETVCAAALSMKGKREQIPPMFSAVRVNGTRLMELARKGITVERAARPIEIYDISAKPLSERCFQLDIRCSKGTYIRTVCSELGTMLGCGGYMSALCRTEAAGFLLSQTHTLTETAEMSENERASLILPLEETVFLGLKRFTYPPFYETLAKSGLSILIKKLPNAPRTVGERVLLCDEQGFFALGEVCESEKGTVLKPVKRFRL